MTKNDLQARRQNGSHLANPSRFHLIFRRCATDTEQLFGKREVFRAVGNADRSGRLHAGERVAVHVDDATTEAVRRRYPDCIYSLMQ